MPDYVAAARRAARKYGLDPNIFVRQIRQESGFNPNARSPAGATGIAQIMPATARGWGVNPNDPIQSLNAAAKNMASYVKKYGGYENALRAYNAGPGAIEASRNYGETNHYVQVILRGRDPGGLGSPQRGGSPSSRRRDTGAQVAPATIGPDPQARKAALLGYLQNRHDPNALLALAAGLQQAETAQSPPGYSEPQHTPAQRGGGGRQAGVGGQLRELFYNGPGGVNVKDGKRVGKGFVSGHTKHVHVAGGPESMRRLGRLAQEMGLNVRENADFDPVDPVHTTNSYHYRYGGRGALDISGDPKKMAEYARRVARAYGLA